MPEAFAYLAAERAGIPCVLGDFHLLEGSHESVVVLFYGMGTPMPAGSYRTFLTCLRREAP
jgi:hypothetical protein